MVDLSSAPLDCASERVGPPTANAVGERSATFRRSAEPRRLEVGFDSVGFDSGSSRGSAQEIGGHTPSVIEGGPGERPAEAPERAGSGGRRERATSPVLATPTSLTASGCGRDRASGRSSAERSNVDRARTRCLVSAV